MKPVHRRALVMLTGASRGLGRALVMEMSKNSWWREADGTRIVPWIDRAGREKHLGSVTVDWVLWSRNKGAIDETIREVRKRGSYSWTASYRDCTSLRAGFADGDFPTKVNQVFEWLKFANKQQGKKKVYHYDWAILINNAGDLGDPRPIGKTRVKEWADEMHRSLQINTIAPTILAKRFIEAFRTTQPKMLPSSRVTVVYVTSVAAQDPFESWSHYCSTKAAGEMLHRSLAAENPDVEFLAYSPGPMDTNMQVEIRKRMLDSSETRKSILNIYPTAAFVRCEDAAHALVRVLTKKGKPGVCRHVDYFDVATDLAGKGKLPTQQFGVDGEDPKITDVLAGPARMHKVPMPSQRR